VRFSARAAPDTGQRFEPVSGQMALFRKFQFRAFGTETFSTYVN
jgi:hypothetical protein